MKLFQFILGKFLGGLAAIAAMVLLVGLEKSKMLPDSLMIPVIALALLSVVLVVVLTWSVRAKVGLTAKLILTWVLLGIEGSVIFLLIQLQKAQLLPGDWVLLIGAIVTVFIALGVTLTWISKGTKGHMITGVILSVLLVAVLCVGSFYIWKAVSTLNRISTVKTETVQMGVCMRTNDKRELDANFKFGVLIEEDRQATDSMIEKLNGNLNAEISCKEYDPTTLLTLIDDLFRGELDAIILNKAYVDMLSEFEGYEDIPNRIRDVIVEEVEIEIPVEDEPEEEEQDAYPSMDGSFAIYISGIDARSGGVGVKTRSDVNIIAVVNPDTRQVLLINTPRDYYVPISSPKSYLDGKSDKLTHAGLGGPEYSKKTLSNLYGIDIAYYFKVNFSGFVNIVDALDGITVHSDFNFQSTAEDGTVYTYHKGENELNGYEALAFCRNRKSFAEGDKQRGKNQMAVIKAVINKMMSPKLLSNYTQILDAVSDSMEMTVPTELIGDLVSRQLSEGGAWNVVSYDVDNGGDAWKASPAAGGAEAYMMLPDTPSVNRAKQLIQDLIDGKTVTLN